MTDVRWQPTASWNVLHNRADMLRRIRTFFAERDVLEVDTPLLSHAGVTDVHLQNVTAQLQGPGMPIPTTFYLQTSPEYAMKRLLAAGSGSIYQICKVVRDDEISVRHNPEFTMLEWYRPGFSDADLMAETDVLVRDILGCAEAEYVTYQDAFQRELNIDPLTSAGIAELKQRLLHDGYGSAIDESDSADTLLQLAMSMYVEPNIGQERPCFVTHFPASQAALAKLSTDDPRVSHRFELFYQGLELANGFWELTDAKQQRQRFEQDNRERKALGLQEQPVDERFLAALDAGIPECAGIAVGLDRLLMLRVGAQDISQVLSFPIERA
ncbi:elongation factor P--(R)-beta-lysine ligase [Aliidiomarina halalkaliphila]|uniref:Elongation factor P--(R)-beta-lysine ligase n=1 Tax=Aliidiomarina halalkaliphila TaxID=2593535 RepID=A0A552X0F0_9GAMM|nr:elongation factor P--(R)-beta-lysine ligase [Aliidiomarina halalkaliphila]TRW48530.1 elongation factor P--(R)-beta-lysine ligase [Aliidiomarina halalkaliphila]